MPPTHTHTHTNTHTPRIRTHVYTYTHHPPHFPPARPSIMIYGGTIKPGHAAADGAVLDIVSAFQSYGEGV